MAEPLLQTVLLPALVSLATTLTANHFQGSLARKQSLKDDIESARKAASDLSAGALEYVNALMHLEDLREKIVELSDPDYGQDVEPAAARERVIAKAQLELNALSGARWRDASNTIDAAETRLIELHTVLLTRSPGILLTKQYNFVLNDVNAAHREFASMLVLDIEDINEPIDKMARIDRARTAYNAAAVQVKTWLIEHAEHLRKARDSAFYRLTSKKRAFARMINGVNDLL